MSIYESGLEEFVKRNAGYGRLNFTTDLAEVPDNVEVVFAVITPPDEVGGAGSKYVLAVASKFR